jgi:hypothetical protein
VWGFAGLWRKFPPSLTGRTGWYAAAMRRSTPWLGLCLLLAACEAPPLVERGGDCHSLSDCEPGLTCVERRCSDDLSSLRGEVPRYETADAAVPLDAALDAEAGVLLDAQIAVDASPPRLDAAPPDAARPRDTGVPDSAPPQPDTSVPDTSVPDAAPDVDAPDADPEVDAAPDAELPDAG